MATTFQFQKAHDCRLNSAPKDRRRRCGTSTPGWILASVGGTAILLALVLLAGAAAQSSSPETEQPSVPY